MQEEAPDELVGVEPHHLDSVAIGVVAPAEANVLTVEGDEAVVGGGGLMAVAPEIGQDLKHCCVGRARRLFVRRLTGDHGELGGKPPKPSTRTDGRQQIRRLSPEADRWPW